MAAQPENLAPVYGLAMLLTDIGQAEEAKAILTEALGRNSRNYDLRYGLAYALSNLRDWVPAFRLWAELKQEFPAVSHIRRSIAMFIGRARLDQASSGTEFEIPSSLVEDEEDSESEDNRGLFMRFEGLGSDCEFGLVQRHFSAEPLGLLRWTQTSPDKLIHALEQRFDGMDLAEDACIKASPKGEYFNLSKRYGMLAHTFVIEGQVDRDKFIDQQVRRTGFLKRKLIEDLAAGEKIFVYTDDRNTDTAILIQLHDAILSYGGGANFLCVKKEDAYHAAGTLEELRQGLLVGRVERFAMDDPPIRSWVKLCRAALQYSRDRAVIAA